VFARLKFQSIIFCDYCTSGLYLIGFELGFFLFFLFLLVLLSVAMRLTDWIVVSLNTNYHIYLTAPVFSNCQPVNVPDRTVCVVYLSVSMSRQ